MRRAQAVARSTGQNIERSMGGLSLRTSQAFAGIRVAAAGLGLTLGASVLISQARAAFEFAAGLGETARSIGVTVEQLQILRRAAIENGASVEGMERTMSILNRTLGQARAGVPAAVQAFRALRIDPSQFRSAGEVIPRVMEAIRGLATQSEQAAAAQRLMGRGVAEMIPFLVQGAAGYDRVAEAARAAGLVTEDQARRADEASDKLALLAVTLRTNLASALVDILPFIENVVTGLGAIITTATQAIGFINSIRIPGFGDNGPSAGNALAAMFPWMPFGQWHPGGNANSGPGPLAMAATAAPPDTGFNNLDLSPHGGGGGGAGRAEAERKRRLREDHEFESARRRNQMDLLREQQQQTEDATVRSNLDGEILALESAQFTSDQQLAVALGDTTQTRANILIEDHAQLDLAKRLTIADGLYEDDIRGRSEIQRQDNDRRLERLHQADGLAETAAEKREIELQILDETIRYERLRLQEIINNRQTLPGDLRDAQHRLANLDTWGANERTSVMRSTRGPLEEYLATLPTTAARAREALQGVAVNGLQSITDGLAAAITGTRKWGDVFKDVAAGILADLIKIQIEQRIVGLIGGAINSLFGSGANGSLTGANTSLSAFGGLFGNLPPRAAGGPVLPGGMYLVGEKGPEILRMGGSAGRVISNDNIGGGGVVIHQTFAPNFAGNAATKQEMLQLAAMVKPMAQEAYRDMARRR